MAGIAGLTPAFDRGGPHSLPSVLGSEVLPPHLGPCSLSANTSILAPHWEEGTEKGSERVPASHDNHLRWSAP